MFTRKYINFAVIFIIGIGLPFYYKVKFWLGNFIELSQILDSIWVDLLFSFGLATAILLGHDFIVSFLKRKFSTKTQHVQRLFVQFIITSIYSIAAVYGYTIFFYTYIFPYGVVASYMFDFILVGLFIPILVSGIKESLYFYGEWEVEKIKKEQLQKENITARYEILKNQINPHFLFNCFNTLTEIIDQSKEMAVKFVHQLSRVYRFVLEHKDNEVVELEDELTVLNSYVFLQKLRFGDSLIINNSIKDDEKFYNIVPLTLQILLENALKHNIASIENPLQIDISVSEDSKLVFKNSLQKKNANGSTKIGLQNIINRYKYITKSAVDVKETAEDFVVKVPLIKDETA